jgi:Spy/CpxP family protein refolding chaperone
VNKNIFIVLLLMAIIALPAVSQHPRNAMPPRKGADLPLFKKLHLTESQEVQMKKLRLELMKKQTQLRARMQTLQFDNKEHFLADKVDRKAVENNVKSITDVQEQLRLNLVDHWFSVNAMLNPDQQKLWKEHAMQFGDQARARFGMGSQGRGRGPMQRNGCPRCDVDD